MVESITKPVAPVPPPSVRALRAFSAGIALALLVGCVTLLTRGPGVQLRTGDYPRAYLLLEAIFWAALLASLAVSGLAHKVASPIARGLRGLSCFNGALAVGAALLSSGLLAWQIETWLVPGSFLVGLSGLVATALAIGLLFVITGPREFPSVHSLTRLMGRGGRGLLDAAGSRAILSALLLVVLVRAGFCIYSAATAPLLCDEAGTSQIYAKSFGAAFTQYENPNNHIVNSVLMKLSTAVFGSGLLAVRLFAVVAGILSPLAVFALATRLCGARVALLAAAFESVSQWVLLYSFQARGYAFISALTPLVLWSLVYALEEIESARRWKSFTILCCLALAVLPTMLYLWAPLFLFSIGIAVHASFTAHRKLFSAGLLQVVGAFAVVMAVTICVYLNPAFFLYRTGLGLTVFHGGLGQPQSVSALAQDVARQFLLGPVEAWAPAPSAAFGWALGAASLFGVLMLLFRRLYMSFFLSACLVVVPVAMIAVQRDLPFARHFSFLISWVHVVAAFGLTEALRVVGAGSWTAPRSSLGWSAAVLCVFGALFWQSGRAVSEYLRAYGQELWPAARISAWLVASTNREDAIVCDSCLEYMIDYRIGAERHITTVAEWWATGTPNASRVFVIPSRGDHDPGDALAKRFVARVCGVREPAHKVVDIGRQEVYLCASAADQAFR
jgi:hypothetical protein